MGIKVNPPPYMPGHTVQVVNFQTGTYATGTTQIPFDNTIPQKTEGDEYMNLAIMPRAANNKLKIDVVWIGSHTRDAFERTQIVALFQDDIANAIKSAADGGVSEAAPRIIAFSHFMIVGTTSQITFKVRSGHESAGTTYFNGNNSGQKHGGTMASSITITETKA